MVCRSPFYEFFRCFCEASALGSQWGAALRQLFGALSCEARGEAGGFPEFLMAPGLHPENSRGLP